jgi:hypothetical protein
MDHWTTLPAPETVIVYFDCGESIVYDDVDSITVEDDHVVLTSCGDRVDYITADRVLSISFRGGSSDKTMWGERSRSSPERVVKQLAS